MKFDTPDGQIEIIDEPTYSFRSTDNIRTYPFSKNLDTEYSPNTIYGVLLDGVPLAVFADCGGATRVHEESCIFLDGQIHLAIGNHVVCFTLNPFVLKWVLQTDPFTCFGIHYQPQEKALISHGELEIARFSFDGKLLWNAGGADIFTEGFSLFPDFIQAIDFEHKMYKFQYSDGRPCA